MTQTNETTSLLTAHECETGTVENHRHEPTHSDSKSHSGRTTVILCGLFVILFQFADILRFAPSLHLLELGYCRNYYLEHDPRLIDSAGHIPERLCKLQEIQEDLSSIRAWLGFLEGLVGLVLVIPYGMLSEKIGGRFVAALNLFGYALSSVWIIVVCFFWKTFPIDAIVVSPMLRAVGGGAPVSSAVILAIVASAVPASKRSSAFFLMGAAELITEMIMPLVSTAFLSNGFVYTPILLGFVFEGLALLAIYYVPVDTYTMPLEASLPTNTQQDDSQNVSQAPSGAAKSNMLKNLAGVWRVGGIMTDAKVVTLLGCFALVKVGRQMLEMLVQYISGRYGWTFAQANIAFSVRATGSLLLFLFILPVSKQILQDVLHFHTDRVDYLLAVASNVFLITGSLCMGLARTVSVFFIGLVVFTFGSGFRLNLQSLLSSFVERRYLTRLYTVIALFDGAGSVVWALLINGGLKQGIHKGAAWIGLPFFIATAAYLISMIGVFVVRDKRTL